MSAKIEIDMRDWRYSVWITNATGSPLEIWRQARSRANDENTIKELKEDFALGGFSMKRFYSVEAAMLLRVLAYNLFICFKHEFLGRKERNPEASYSPVHLLYPPWSNGT
jgi:hypothetical protein